MKLTWRRDRDDKSGALTLWLREPYSGPHARLYLAPTYRHVGCTVTVGGEDRDLSIAFGLGFFVVASLRVLPWSFRHWTYAWAGRMAERNKAAGRHTTYAHELDPMDGRETGVRIHDGSIWWNLWHNDHCWASADRKVWPWQGNGWTWTWHVWDWIVGATDYHAEPGTWHDAERTIDGIVYPFRVHLYRCRWSRRWPWRGRWLHRGQVALRGHAHNDPAGELEKHDPPMRAGKGENSWDCEPDGCYAMSVAARPEPYTVNEIVGEYAADYERDVKRYGRAS